MAEIRIEKRLAYVLLSLFVGMAMFTAYRYGRQETSKQTDVRTKADAQEAVIVGRIVGFEPPTVRIRSIWDAEETEHAIIIDPHTRIFKMVPWETGERAEAIRAFEDQVAKLKLQKGDRVPPPPGEMKAARMAPDDLAVGLDVAIGLDPVTDDGGPPSAMLVRPLTEKEIAERTLTATFPY